MIYSKGESAKNLLAQQGHSLGDGGDKGGDGGLHISRGKGVRSADLNGSSHSSRCLAILLAQHIQFTSLAQLLVSTEETREPEWVVALIVLSGQVALRRWRLAEWNGSTAFSALEAKPATDPRGSMEATLAGQVSQLLNVLKGHVHEAPAVALARMLSLFPAGSGLQDVDVAVFDGAAVIVGLGLLAKVNGLGDLALLLSRLFGKDAAVMMAVVVMVG